MKRKVLAILVPALLMAGAANAAEMYNKNGNKVDLYGKVDARHTFSDNPGDDGDETYVQVGFKGETQITNDLTGTASGNIKPTLTIPKAQATPLLTVWPLLA